MTPFSFNYFAQPLQNYTCLTSIRVSHLYLITTHPPQPNLSIFKKFFLCHLRLYDYNITCTRRVKAQNLRRDTILGEAIRIVDIQQN